MLSKHDKGNILAVIVSLVAYETKKLDALYHVLHRRLFPNIYGKRELVGQSRSEQHRKPGGLKRKPAAATTCTLNFCCLEKRSEFAPGKEKCATLKLAGLGREKVSFDKRDGGHQYVQAELQQRYPKLCKADGKYLLYKGRSGSDRSLTKIQMGQEGKI